ncbi:MAG: hypothetical protein ABI273_22180 [Lacunisphaera sp.]
MSPATLPRQLIEAPASDAYRTYETLGYIDAYDAILNGDYAFVAFKETDRLTGAYIIKITSKGTAGASFNPTAMRTRCREAAAKSEAYFTWGYSFTPSPDDPRQIEFRVYQTAGAPAALEIFVVTRNADGSAKPAKSLRIENFIAESPAARAPLVEAPVSDASRLYQTLGYVEAYDAVLNCDYAFVAYQETEQASGQWRVCIKSTQTAGGSFDPAAIRGKARETGAQGRSYFTWGYQFEPTAGDPRQIEFRVYVADGGPSEVEIFVRLRKADHSADQARAIRFRWPQEL